MSKFLVDLRPAREIAVVVVPTLRFSPMAAGRREEAVGLVRALGATCAYSAMMPIREVRAGELFGQGQLSSIQDILAETRASMLVVDARLTPVQQRNLEKRLAVKVIDRTGLILEIFGLRARTAEGRLQVELARQKYERSRLVRTWTHLERQRGGGGFMGGPGETQIESDRRMLDRRIRILERDLDAVRDRRRVQRALRDRGPSKMVALVGYTNAGKSSLFNRLTGANVPAENMPFATLDPTVRVADSSSYLSYVVADTVGFITDLPPELIASFRATLEETMSADLLLHVRDVSHPDTHDQAYQVESILRQLQEEHGSAPAIFEVWNKIDLLDSASRSVIEKRAEDHQAPVFLVSSTSGVGVAELLTAVELQLAGERIRRTVRIASGDGRLRSWIFDHCEVFSESVSEDGAFVEVDTLMTQVDASRFEALMLRTDN